MDTLTAFGRALSDPTRIRILNALRQSELCVCELVDALGVSQSTLSTHLQLLRSNGMVVVEKRQTWNIYSIATDARGAIDHAFESFPSNDIRLASDQERIENRIRLRIDGCCVVGFGVLQKKEETIYVNN